MTLDNFVQWHVVKTLFPETIQLHSQKDGFKETRELGLYQKSQPVFNTANMGLKSESGLWVKTILILGSEFLMEQINMWLIQNYNNTEVPADLPEEQASQSSVKVIAARSKAKSKPQMRETVELPSTVPMNERKWIDIEPAEPSLSAYEVSKKVINLLRHNQTIQREDDGAVQFWRIKFHLRNQFPQNQYWSDDRWKVCLAAGGGSKRRYQYCSDNSGTILYLRALQGHSGRNLIHPLLQDNVVIESGLFNHIHHIGCAFNLHSIINNGLIPGGQDLSRRQTVFFLPIDPRDKDHQDPEHIDFSVPRRAQYVHSAWKKHQDAVFLG